MAFYHAIPERKNGSTGYEEGLHVDKEGARIDVPTRSNLVPSLVPDINGLDDFRKSFSLSLRAYRYLLDQIALRSPFLASTRGELSSIRNEIENIDRHEQNFASMVSDLRADVEKDRDSSQKKRRKGGTGGGSDGGDPPLSARLNSLFSRVKESFLLLTEKMFVIARRIGKFCKAVLVKLWEAFWSELIKRLIDEAFAFVLGLFGFPEPKRA